MKRGYWGQLLLILLLLALVAAVFFLVGRFYDVLLKGDQTAAAALEVEDVIQSLSQMLEAELRSRYQELETRLARLQALLAQGDLQPGQRQQYASELEIVELQLIETQAELADIRQQPPADAPPPAEAEREELPAAADPGLENELEAARAQLRQLREVNARQEERIRRLGSLGTQQETRAEQLSAANAQLEQQISALQERIDTLSRQLAEAASSDQSASRRLALAQTENRLLFERADINGLFYSDSGELRVALNPARRARILEVGTYNVYTGGGRTQSTRVLVFEEGGEILFRVYPGFQQPQAGEWF